MQRILARPPASSPLASLAPFALALALFSFAACSGDDGDTGPQGPPGDGGPTDTVLDPDEDAPGVNVEIVSLTGGTGPNGNFRVGDQPRVRFFLRKDDGSDWDITEMNTARALVGGPTFNYQRVLAQVTDLATASVANSDGSYSYTFAEAIPATYLAPLNDSDSFGEADGELTGQALLSGTYTLGMYFSWNYTVEGDSFRDTDDVTHDFLFGSASTIDTRAAVAQENCNQCHVELQAHGGPRRSVTLCLLCHTAGAEDRNVATAAGGTPGVSIDFRVMIHKIHNGEHLPSVLGVATNLDGTRDYDAEPQPYLIVGNQNSIHDYSQVLFPVWPNGLVAMPRDEGYTALPAPAKTAEDTIRTGVTNCAVCHGDPDGDGPIGAPAQGDLFKTEPSRQACGSCHDDVSWGHDYTANGMNMPAQANNSNCTLCHEPAGNELAIVDGHRHPLYDANFNQGLEFEVTDLGESGAHNGNDKLDPGEKVEITFRIRNAAGDDVAASTLASVSNVISGPTSNYNLLLNGSIPIAALAGPQPYTTRVPEVLSLEYVGDASGPGDVLSTSRAPHWNLTGALTSVMRRSATGGGASVLSAAAGAVQNHLEVANPGGLAANDVVVIDDGVLGSEEYATVRLVQGNRVWITPATRKAHLAGASVLEVTLTPTSAYTLDAAAGTLSGDGSAISGQAIVVTYTSDFVVPTVYPIALNESPDLGEAVGEWRGKPLVPGTYSYAIWGQQNLTLALYGETNAYRNTAVAEKVDFLVGSATEIEPYDLVASGASCNACHVEVGFHGWGRRGFDACVVCHGTAGSEDRPQYVAPNAPPTAGVTINMRDMLHKIHMGEELANASTYTLVGFGAAPANFTAHTYGEVVFPALPGGVQRCDTCHGDSDAWKAPADRDHPAGQSVPTQVWTNVCASCHDSDAVLAHISAQTSAGGAESCSICHGTGDQWNVELMHKTR